MGRISKFFGKFKHSARDESGAVLVIVAVAITVLIGFTALAVDMGLVYYQRSRLQTALDAAVLAAAYDLPARTLDPGQLAIQQVKTEATVQQYLLKNGFEADDIKDLNVELLENNRIVRVTGHIDTEALFAAAVDVESIGSNGIAAAESAVKTIPFYFEHLIFQGAGTRLDLLGAISTVNGSIHSNGSYYVDTHWTIQHIEGVNENYSDGSANTTGSSINTGTWGGAHVESHTDGVDYIEMPDWDSTLMDIATLPVAKEAPTPPNNSWWLWWWSNPGNYTTVQGDLNTQSTKTYNDSMYIGGNLNVPWGGNVVFNGDVYVYGGINVAGGGSVVFNGRVYCRNNMTFGWNTNSTFEKDVYVRGNLSGSGSNGFATTCRGDFYVAGTYTNGGSSHRSSFMQNFTVVGNATFGGEVLFMGDCYCGGSAEFNCQGYTLTFNGDTYVKNRLVIKMGGGAANINKSLMVWNNGVITTDNVLTISGINNFNNADVSVNGSVYTSGSGDPSVRINGGVMYIAGNFDVSNSICASGCIFVDNDITFHGGDTDFYQDPDSIVALYSRNGDIIFTTAETTAYGLIFAPKGKITLEAHLAFYGNIIADTLSISTGGLTVGQNTREMPFGIPSKTSILVE